MDGAVFEISAKEVTVEKFTCVADVGTIMNRLLVDGNFYGGLAQGIGLALSEDFDDLTKHTSLKGCGIPYPKDIPDGIELHYVETYRPEGPYGAAGCGEAPLDAPHPALRMNRSSFEREVRSHDYRRTGLHPCIPSEADVFQGGIGSH